MSGESLHVWAPNYRFDDHTGCSPPLEEILQETENLTAYRIALSSHFPLFVDRIEAQSAEMHDAYPSALEKTGYSDWLLTGMVLGEVCSHLTNLRSFPQELASRFLNACLDMILLTSSFSSLSTHASSDMGRPTLQRALEQMAAFCNILRKFPDVSFDLELTMLSFDRNTELDVAAGVMTGGMSPMKRKDVLYHWMSYEIEKRVSQPNSAAYLCAALGLQLPSPKHLYRLPLQVWSLPNATQRLERAEFAHFSKKIKGNKWESCIACGLYQRTNEAIAKAYKQCSSCAFAT